jgi:LEA14-like dessication related protein
MKKLIPIGAVVAAIYIISKYLTGRSTAMKNLSIAPVSISIDTAKSRAANWFQIFYKVKVNLINNEFQPVIVRGLDLDVKYKNKIVSKITRDADFTVAPRAQKIVELNTSLSSTNIITSIVDIFATFRDGEKTISFDIVGFIDTDLGSIPVNFTKKLDF